MQALEVVLVRINHFFSILTIGCLYKQIFVPGRKYAMLKLKVLLATIMRNFQVKSDISENEFKLQADIILKRAEGFLVKLEPRKPKKV